MMFSTILAIGLVIAQGAVVWGFLRFVKSFGAYTASQQQLTAALLYTHESNLALHQSNQCMLERLATLQASLKTKEVA